MLINLLAKCVSCIFADKQISTTMLILSFSSFIHWVIAKLLIVICAIIVFGMIYILIGSTISSKIRDRYIGFH